MTDADWATDLIVDSVGTPMRVRVTEPFLGRLVEEALQHFPTSEDHPRIVFSVTDDGATYTVWKGDDRVVQRESRSRTLMQLLAAINETTILGDHDLVIHAGAIARDDMVVAFPASRNAGKSTLVAACLEAGFDYVTDEAVFTVAGSLRIIPYPKALWLTEESRSLLGLDLRVEGGSEDGHKLAVAPGRLGATLAGDSCFLRHVVLLERNSGLPNLSSIGPAEVAFEMLNHAFNRYDRPRAWFEHVTLISGQVKGWRLSYDDPKTAASYLAGEWAPLSDG